MTEATVSSFAVILTVAVLAPIASDRLARWVLVPSVVLEMLGGIVIGPDVLDLVTVDAVIGAISSMGLAALFFLAGYEVQLERIRGSPLRSAAAGWGLSLVLGVGGALAVGLVTDADLVGAFIVGLALTATALGTLLPIVRDAELLPTRFGSWVLAIGSIGEFGPIVAIALLLSGRRPLSAAVLLVVFVVLAVGAAWLATRAPAPWLSRLLSVTLGTSAQLAVRLSVLLVVLLVWVAAEFRLDTLLGAFASGMVVRLAVSTTDPHEVHVVELKLEALAYGFFVPVFFIVSGVRFDLQSFLDSPVLWLLVPGFCVAFLIVRGLPTLLTSHHRDVPVAHRRALALVAASTLPLVVAITAIGVQEGVVSTGVAAGLVGAGLLSVMVFPSTAIRVIRTPTPPSP